jgi:hypothetical protein
MNRNEAQQKLVDEWNSKNAVGCKVLVRKDDGEEIETVTSGLATVLCGTAVCWGNAISGAYMLERFRAIHDCIYCQHTLSEPFPFETDKGDAVCDDCGQERNMQ